MNEKPNWLQSIHRLRAQLDEADLCAMDEYMEKQTTDTERLKWLDAQPQFILKRDPRGDWVRLIRDDNDDLYGPTVAAVIDAAMLAAEAAAQEASGGR